MGFIGKILRKVISASSTAKWACIQYKMQKENHPKLNDRQLLENIIKARYKFFSDQQAEHTLLGNINNTNDLFALVVGMIVQEKGHSSTVSNFDNLVSINKEVSETIEELGCSEVKFDIS